MKLLISFFFFFSNISVSLAGSDYKISVHKSERVMKILKKGMLIKSYDIALGTTPVGKKRFQGDGKTPEGVYKIEGKNPGSQFYRALRISYPNARDIAFARSKGKKAGGHIMIHGLGKTFCHLGKKHLTTDWTLGCVAVTDEEMQEIYHIIPVGTVIEIYP